MIPWNWETALFVAIFVLGALLRFWDLGSRALHHDESIHAVHSWYILSGKGMYRRDPTYHGPFLYYSEALAYFLFGATNYAARIMPAPSAHPGDDADAVEALFGAGGRPGHGVHDRYFAFHPSTTRGPCVTTSLPWPPQ